MAWTTLFSILVIWMQCTARFSDFPDLILEAGPFGLALHQIVTLGNAGWLLVLAAELALATRARTPQWRSLIGWACLSLVLIGAVQVCVIEMAGAAERVAATGG